MIETLLIEKTIDEFYGPYPEYDNHMYAFMNIRPPGHHAGGKQGIHGFCFLNNVV